MPAAGSNEQRTFKSELSLALPPAARSLLVVLTTAALGLVVGYLLSGLHSYKRYFTNGFSEGYGELRYAPSLPDLSSSSYMVNGVSLGRGGARYQLRLLTPDLRSSGICREGTGWCILNATVVDYSDTLEGTPGHVPGCVSIEGGTEMSYSQEYSIEPDGIWSRDR